MEEFRGSVTVTVGDGDVWSRVIINIIIVNIMIGVKLHASWIQVVMDRGANHCRSMGVSVTIEMPGYSGASDQSGIDVG
jgi:hypothetical protein